MLINVEVQDYSSFDLALVQWYDFCYKDVSNDSRCLYEYGYPLLKVTNMFNVVTVESFIELVQIVQRAE